MRSGKFVKQIVLAKKEVYYPLFSILFSFLVYWLFVAFNDSANSPVIFAYLLSIMAIIIMMWSIDCHRSNQIGERKIPQSFILILFCSAILLMSFMVVWLGSYISEDHYYLIPVAIYILVSCLIFFVLKKAMKTHYQYSVFSESVLRGNEWYHQDKRISSQTGEPKG